MPLVRLEDAGHALQQRRLARAVVPDDAEHLALLDVERDVVEGDELVEVVAPPAGDELLERVGPVAMAAGTSW